ncbi:MAG: ATP-binding protein [Parachlamydiaceae bacterium]|nr:ATP-binding protein [Parachlamydiaceae bacterium]
MSLQSCNIPKLETSVHDCFNSILTHMSQGLLFITSEGYLTLCNPAAETILEISSPDHLFTQWSTQFDDAWLGFPLKQSLIEKRSLPKQTIHFKGAKGTTRELEIESTFVTPSQHSKEGLIVFIRDVTDLHRLQEMNQRRDRLHALGEMAAMVAHEIRNPLGSIKGFASLLERDLQDQPALHRMAKDIVLGTDNLNRLVTNVLNYSRPLQAEIVLQDLVALVSGLCRQIEADTSLDTRIVLSFHSDVPALMVPLDQCLLTAALLNVITNAIQALPNGGKIDLSVIRTDHAQIQVADNGVGIPKENLKKLFLPFFTTKVDGNGFGLADVQRMIQAHAGTVDVHSEENKGTVFTIKLPLDR